MEGLVIQVTYLVRKQKTHLHFLMHFFFLFGFAKAEVSFGHQNIKDLGVPFFSRETSGQTAS